MTNITRLTKDTPDDALVTASKERKPSRTQDLSRFLLLVVIDRLAGSFPSSAPPCDNCAFVSASILTISLSLFEMWEAVVLFVFYATKSCESLQSIVPPPFVERHHLVGIWKVSRKIHQPFPNPSEMYKDLIGRTSLGGGMEDEIVVRLNDDGTFDPYTTVPPAYDDEIEGQEDSLQWDFEAITKVMDEWDLQQETQQQNLHQLFGQGGKWEYRDHTLLLAPDRPPQAEAMAKKLAGRRLFLDTLFRGSVEPKAHETLQEDYETTQFLDYDLTDGDEYDNQDISKVGSLDPVPANMIDTHLSIPQGQISAGRFLYPFKHQRFFDEPVLLDPVNLGFFAMDQLLGTLNAGPGIDTFNSDSSSYEDPSVANGVDVKFVPRDFYNRTFYLATAEYPIDQEAAKLHDKHFDENNPDTGCLDVRAMPVTFYPNNTFAAFGAEKILRGKFGITGETKDQLWMQVSLFGAGRSVSGSVFSEGRLLSQDDKRGYLGLIQSYPACSSDDLAVNKHEEPHTLHYVYGKYYYGTPDLEDPEEIGSNMELGTFILQELEPKSDQEYEDAGGWMEYPYDDDDEEFDDGYVDGYDYGQGANNDVCFFWVDDWGDEAFQ